MLQYEAHNASTLQNQPLLHLIHLPADLIHQLATQHHQTISTTTILHLPATQPTNHLNFSPYNQLACMQKKRHFSPSTMAYVTFLSFLFLPARDHLTFFSTNLRTLS